MKIKKIIVHPKTFHPDEIVALAVMRIIFPYLRKVRIVRTRPTVQELNDPAVLVIDCGGYYDPEKNNFDHHQDKNLPCASRLIWRHFYPEDTEDQKQLKRVMDVLFFRSIDRHDRGVSFAGSNSIGLAISSMNFLPDGFRLAIHYAELTLRAFIAKQQAVLPVRNFWRRGVSFGGSRRLRIFPEYLSVHMKDKIIKYATDTKKALFLLWPLDAGMYIVHVVHKDQKIPTDKRQIDNDDFSAVYKNKQDALAHALELAAQKFERKRYWNSVKAAS